ncbi:MAG: PHP domain-containing protein [Candidatus Acidiferrales bacterium]
MENRDVARILRETASLLEIDGAFIGRYRSYERTAELLDSLPESIAEIATDPARLEELPGIGERMAEHIQEILKTGDYSLRKKLLKKYPATILDLLTLQSLGPKKVALLWKNFKAGTVEQVEKLAREGKLRDLAGFGEKSEQNILKAVEAFKRSSGRFLINQADATAQKLIAYIAELGAKVESVTAAGSLRRARETVGDLDLLVTFAKGQYSRKNVDAVADHIVKYPEIEEILVRGENKVSVRLKNTMQMDVRLLEKELNEYALATLKGERRVAGATEEEVYAKLKLDWIPPELRENTGEIEAAAEHRLPKLIELADMRGDLQMHTTASDGANSIEEMGAAGRALGYEYIALTDHSQAVTVANGMDERRTLEQIKKIHAANDRAQGIRLLAGIEVDIRKDGSLDLDDEVLAQLDVVVASVHSYMNIDRAAMTDRLLAAIENPYTQILAHPTGRLLLRRDSFEYDFEKILEAARRNGVVVECNAAPERLDLKDVYLRMAKDRGVRVVISTDAHSTRGLGAMRFGVNMARRGWLEKRDVINTLPLGQFLAALRPKPGSGAAKPAPATGKGKSKK